MTPETKIKKEITAYLKSLGPKCWFAPYVQNGMGKAGVPDLLVCYRSKFVSVEVKAAENKKPTTWQEREMNAIVAADGVAIVAWNVEHVKACFQTLDDFIETLNDL